MTDNNPINAHCRAYLEQVKRMKEILSNEMEPTHLIEDVFDLEDDVDPNAYKENQDV
jgi:hypothetical protein